ncbi:glycosyltransferase family 39 protein [Fundidesulfovibrio terrae]|uniref:glycosyltransferase family 39 protein n=1 Tax=Fundidesulfovibrio terrae TaxID=2922866 RepID=UPI001FAF30E6|nr:glycosyltransferase family 39 protein [Fundidesulfovibrio terrae]
MGGWELAVLAFILLAAGFLRLYALGVPMLLHDEALVTGAAAQEWGYILRRSLYTDAHPPFYYFLNKLVIAVASDDFSVRLISAVGGTAAVYVLYRLGARLVSRGAGLVAASLLAVDLLHVALSRAVRPHALVLLLTLVAAQRLVGFLDRPSARNAWLLIAASFLTALWHFNGGLVIGSELAVVGVAILMGALGARMGLFTVAGLGACLAASAAPMLARMGKFPGVALGGNSMLWTATRTLENLRALLDVVPVPGAWQALTVLLLAGFALLWTRRPGPAAVLTAMAALPLAALIALRYGIIYEPQHIAFILPFLLLFVARGALAIPVPATLLAALITAGGAYFLVTDKHRALYEEDSGYINHNWSQRFLAFALPNPFTEKMVAGFYPAEQIDFISWELKRRGLGDPRLNAVGPGDSAVEFYLVKRLASEHTDSRTMFAIEQAGFPRVMDKRLDSGYSLQGFAIPRTPALALDALPGRFAISSDPEFFFRRVYEAHDLRPYFSPLGNCLYPSRFDSPASFTFRVENSSGRLAPNVDIGLVMANTAPGNLFEVLYAFDGETPRAGLSIREVGARGTPTLTLGRTAPFRVLDVTVRMLCSGESPSFYNNPEAVRFDSMDMVVNAPEPGFDSAAPVAVTGLGPVETAGQTRFRWGSGPETGVTFEAEGGEKFVLEMEARSPIPGQRVEVAVNGAPVNVPDAGLFPESRKLAVPVQARKGANVLSVRYALWNQGRHGAPGETFEKDDPRFLAASFTAFRLVRAQSGN